MTAWEMNYDGYWCGACGYFVAQLSSETQPDECRQCGYPDAEKVADYFVGPDDDDDDPVDDSDPGEECGRWINGRLDRSCRLAGTEFCDWECPHGR